MYTYEFPRPSLTVDVVGFSVLHKQLSVMLIQRTTEPFTGIRALPGGIVHIK